MLACSSPIHSAFEFTGTGARASALGGAQTAATGTADGIWFNPASNALRDTWQIGTAHALLYPGLDEPPTLHGLTAALPLSGRLGKNRVQVGLSFLSARNWDEQVTALGLSRPLHPRMAVGLALRSSAWSTVGLSHRAWDMNVGATYEVGWVHPEAYLRLAGVMENLRGSNRSSSGKKAGRSQRKFTIGASLELQGSVFYLDWENVDDRFETRFGLDSGSGPGGDIRIRAGASAVSFPWAGKEVTAGLGHRSGRWNYDYAYAYPLEATGLGGIHRFSLAFEAD